jgi:hypothetical protein
MPILGIKNLQLHMAEKCIYQFQRTCQVFHSHSNILMLLPTTKILVNSLFDRF